MMRFIGLVIVLLIISCDKKETFTPRNFNTVEVETILEDTLLSIRAIEILTDKSLVFASNNGAYGLYSPTKRNWQISKQESNSDSLQLEFRSIAHTTTDFFMLSVNNPAMLFKTGEQGLMDLVYLEEHPKVFYDAMAFWNDKEGIAIGDTTEDCLSVLITRDGGHIWNKLSCDVLPKGIEGEGAFAASNTNIAIVGNNTWIATTTGRVYFSKDKGLSWDVVQTPIINGKETEGIYSIDFYDSLNGFAIGGDYTNPDDNVANKILTKDGGKTWELVAEGQAPGYRSCLQYFPNREGKELIAVGFKGMDYSNDGGNTWKNLSKEGFYTIRFLNDSVAYASGQGRISKLNFR
ncbi:WD40/YVTN/BNR-like repeat-containing protein [Xanthomarina sp. F2636L]|uniref:WD40/YVTN/BNR-like repeat-containing protein n=1 Tax=Xanthomarina sp. F2636L TaxID=2996018 RepID=UPI00225E1814|nr:oxidoreductase [Xanthomarina sp. F2636L]MCX7550164.1 oxidoreductase [Xanthomarina sp. F2636L]